jgi:multiple sugar transport system permease protein
MATETRWRGRRRSKELHAPRKAFGKHLILAGFGIMMLYPLLWMVGSSFKPPDELFTTASPLPEQWTLQNYIDGWSAFGIGFDTFFVNSAIVASLAIVGNLLTCSMAAYAFARLEFRFKKVWFAAMLVTIMLPFHVLIVPQYVMFDAVGWVNTLLPLVVPKFLATDAFFIFLMVQFMRALPRELDDAAEVDGCGPVRIYLRIILPLIMPALATTAVFTFLWTWNDFMTPLIYLTDPQLYTVPIALRSFIDAQSTSSFGAMFAMSVVAIVPLVLAFALGQKYLVQGIATTGLK